MQAIPIMASHHPNFDELYYKASAHFTVVCHRAISTRSHYGNNNTRIPISFTLSLITYMLKLFRKKKNKSFETREETIYFPSQEIMVAFY